MRMTKGHSCLQPQGTNSSNISQFRSITLLNVEGKIFFSAMAKMMSYFTGMKYTDTSYQKVGVPAFSPTGRRKYHGELHLPHIICCIF